MGTGEDVIRDIDHDKHSVRCKHVRKKFLIKVHRTLWNNPLIMASYQKRPIQSEQALKVYYFRSVVFRVRYSIKLPYISRLTLTPST